MAEISEPIRSKLDAIQLSNDTDENLQELRKINAAQQQQHKAAQNSEFFVEVKLRVDNLCLEFYI